MDKIKVCIVGCGRIATLNVLGYKNHPDAEVYAVCDVNEERAREFAAEVGAGVIYTDYDQACADADIQVMELLVPHHLHCKMAVQACNAGKHVSVQKPMAMSLEECDTMIEAARKNGVKLKVYENFIFYPPYVKAKELIEAGEIGEPLTIRIKMNAGKRDNAWKIDPATWSWRMQEQTCGGGPLVFDDGNHKFSIARYFMGEPEKVFAYIDATPMEGRTYTKPDGTVVQFYEDAPAMITWKYKNSGKYGVFDITYSKDLVIDTKYYACDERVEITGSKGVIWIMGCTANMLSLPSVIVYKEGETHKYEIERSDWSYSFIDSTQDFIDAIKNDRRPRLSGEEGREVLKFSIAAIQSSNEKREIYMDELDEYLKHPKQA